LFSVWFACDQLSGVFLGDLFLDSQQKNEITLCILQECLVAGIFEKFTSIYFKDVIFQYH
jgi:hypothetical protein